MTYLCNSLNSMKPLACDAMQCIVHCSVAAWRHLSATAAGQSLQRRLSSGKFVVTNFQCSAQLSARSVHPTPKIEHANNRCAEAKIPRPYDGRAGRRAAAAPRRRQWVRADLTYPDGITVIFFYDLARLFQIFIAKLMHKLSFARAAL